MKTKIYSLIIVLLACMNLQANENFNLNAAEQAYAAGEYEKALAEYNAVLEQGYESADLYYNIANCHYRMKQLAPSILNYERALRLDPSHEDAIHNLKFAESQTLDKIDSIGRIFLVDWWYAICNIASTDVWAWIAIVFFVLSLVGLSVYFFINKIQIRKIGFSVAVVTLFITIIALCSSYTRYSLENAEDQAIVYSQTVTIKSSPDSSGTDLFVLHEGTKVTIKSVLGEDWIEIITSDGNTGWLPAEAIEII